MADPTETWGFLGLTVFREAPIHAKALVKELARRLELLTCCLQDSCATDCATPAVPGQRIQRMSQPAASAVDSRCQNSQSEDAGTTDECCPPAIQHNLLARREQCRFAAY